MSGPANVAREAQRAVASPFVTLYDIDARPLGGDVHYVTASSDAVPILWRGNAYQPFDLESDGWEWNGRGTLPTPRLRVTNVGRVFGALVTSSDDLLGCIVTRWRTFERFLDGRPDADPDGHFPVDIYRIERKTSHDKTHIEWELTAAMDQEGRTLPGRLILRDTCTHRYRVPSDGDYSYAQATCPYVGEARFKPDGTVAESTLQDACGKRLKDCKLRFGATATLPTRAFPGVARTRIA